MSPYRESVITNKLLEAWRKRVSELRNEAQQATNEGHTFLAFSKEGRASELERVIAEVEAR